MLWRQGFLFLAVASASIAHLVDQKPLLVPSSVVGEDDTGKGIIADRRKLHGKFLHITDFHPDRFYSQLSSTDDDDACHWGQGDAGIFGAPLTDCDSPVPLVNATFQWINDNLKSTIDFVVWTGDSARHDNDELIPRTEHQVIESNELLVSKFVEVFGKSDNINDTDPTNDLTIPVVPNFGNNDILPHNIFTPGPNRWTKRFANIWRKFIPEEQRHGFERGGWFFTEVIPSKLAIFSLNTLYFFDNNSAVNGCAQKSEPGYEQFEWLRIQLQFLRERGMKAILMGHVPPARTESKQSWDETCWQKYTLWLRQYRDVIVGGLYGHMNIDHFMLQDNEQIDERIISGEVELERKGIKEGEIAIQSSAEYLTQLRSDWSQLPDPVKVESSGFSSRSWPSLGKGKKGKDRRSKHEEFMKKIGGEFAERFSATFVTASVVPNYFPTMRVFEYNITDVEKSRINDEKGSGMSNVKVGSDNPSTDKPKKPKFKKPDAPSKTAPPGPAYSPQTLSLLGYTQYFANLTRINAAFASPEKSRKAEFNYEVEYNTRNDTLYGLEDLTVRSCISLATRIGNYKPIDDISTSKKKNKHKKHKKQKRINMFWFTFVKRAYVGAKDDENLHDHFG